MIVKIIKGSGHYTPLEGKEVQVYHDTTQWPDGYTNGPEKDDHFYLTCKDHKYILKIHCEVIESQDSTPDTVVSRPKKELHVLFVDYKGAATGKDNQPIPVFASHKDWPAGSEHQDPNRWYCCVHDQKRFISKHFYGPVGQQEVGFDPRQPIFYIPDLLHTLLPVERLPNGEGRLHDPVDRPAHYTDGKIEVIDFIEDKKLNFKTGNAVKYIVRAGKKDPSKYVEDLQKAIWYLKREIAKHDPKNIF